MEKRVPLFVPLARELGDYTGFTVYFRYSPCGLFFIETTTLLQNLNCQTIRESVKARDTFPAVCKMENGCLTLGNMWYDTRITVRQLWAPALWFRRSFL